MDFPILRRKDGTLPIEDEVRRILREALRKSSKPRKQIAREMTESLGRSITTSMLADFTRNATQKRHVRFPLAWTPALAKITGSRELEEFALSLERRERLAIGEWVASSRWILVKVNVEIGTSAKRGLQKARRRQR